MVWLTKHWSIIMSKIYAGTSAFFANRPGNHNWLDNHARPFISLITTKKSGKKRYDDLFLTDVVTVKETAKTVTLTFPKDASKPLFRVAHKD